LSLCRLFCGYSVHLTEPHCFRSHLEVGTHCGGPQVFNSHEVSVHEEQSFNRLLASTPGRRWGGALWILSFVLCLRALPCRCIISLCRRSVRHLFSFIVFHLSFFFLRFPGSEGRRRSRTMVVFLFVFQLWLNMSQENTHGCLFFGPSGRVFFQAMSKHEPRNKNGARIPDHVLVVRSGQRTSILHPEKNGGIWDGRESGDSLDSLEQNKNVVFKSSRFVCCAHHII
jgi:hypothetical protein